MLPGDFNDDGVVNGSDVVGVRNEWLGINGAVPTIVGDINGDGVVNGTDYNDVRIEIGTTLPSVVDPPIALGVARQSDAALVRIGASARRSPRRQPSATARRDSIVRARIDPPEFDASEDDQPGVD